MSTKIRHELHYDGATPEQVYRMLATPEFREEVCDSQHFPRHDVSVTAVGNGMTVSIDQHRPADEVPSFARKFIGDDINILQEEDWDTPVSARLRVTIPGKPGRLDGTVRLSGDGSGTTELVEAEAKVAIPLVAGKLESLIAEFLVKALRAENRVGTDWLTRDGG